MKVKVKMVCYLLVSLLFCIPRASYSMDGELLDKAKMETMKLKIVVGNVGQGNGIFVKDEENGKILILDAGSSTNPLVSEKKTPTEDVWKELVDNIISDVRIKTDEYNGITVIVSHPDSDHLNLLEKFFSEGNINIKKVRKVYLGGNFVDYFLSADGIGFLKSIKGLVEEEEKVKGDETIDSKKKDKLVEEKKYTTNIVSLSHNLTPEEYYKVFREGEDCFKAILETTSKDEEKKETLRKKKLNEKHPFLFNSSLWRLFSESFPVEEFSNNTESVLATKFIGINASRTTKDQEFSNDSNEDSAVACITLNGKNFIFPGDATGKTTGTIISKISESKLLKSEFLVASHHGADSHGSNNAEWAWMTSPSYVVFSAGINAGYKHPRFAAIHNYMPYLKQEKKHRFTFSGEIGRKIDKSQTSFADCWNSTLVEMLEVKDGSESYWINIETQKAAYSTHSSGTITFSIKKEGIVASIFSSIL